MEIRRRDFLKTIGAAGLGAMVLNPVLEAFATTGKKTKNPGALSGGKWIPSTCHGCTTWCPIELYQQTNGSIDRAVKVRGNPLSLCNPGTLCPKGHMAIMEGYDPDRLKTPMKRTNTTKGKGVDPQWVPITWDEAITTVATQLKTLRDSGDAHKIVFIRGRYTPYNRDIMYKGVSAIVGTPNNVSHSSICAEAENFGPYFTEGVWGYRDYNFENSKYILLWGIDPFRSNRMPPYAMKQWDKVRKNATMTVVDPCLTGSASSALKAKLPTNNNKWAAIIPGTDGALASAIAHRILVQGGWHKPFVGDWNSGKGPFVANTAAVEADFTEIYSYGLVKWWNIELKDKTPAWAAPITGISKADIEEIADNMAAAAPNVISWIGPGPTMCPRGGYTSMAINALNGLLGSTRNLGGVFVRPSKSVASLPSYSSYEDAIATTGLANPRIDLRGTLEYPAIEKAVGKGSYLNNVAESMLASTPYDIKAIIQYHNNTAHSCTGGEKWDAAFTALPFHAHITTHASESSQYADILMPACFGTERWGLLNTSANRFTEVDLMQPVATRLFDVKDEETEIPWLIADKLNSLGFTNLYDYLSTQFADPETSALPTNETEFAEIATKRFAYPSYNAQGDTWATFKLKGVSASSQSQVMYQWGNMGTQTKKFEFYSETLKTQLNAHATNNSTTVDSILTTCKYTAQGELAFVPHYEPPLRVGSVAQYPFTFIDSKSRFNREGRSQNNPFYYMFKKLDPGDNNWGDCIKINPTDAATLGVVNGDKVKITSVSNPTTGVIVTVKLYEGVRAGTVAKTYGQGHWAYGRFASDYATLSPKTGMGSNNHFMPKESERFAGANARNGGYCGVQLVKV